MNISGKLLQVSDIENGTSKAGKDYVKCLAIIETTEAYPKKIAVELGKMELIDQVTKKSLGGEISFEVNLESREFNGKWYNSIKAWKVN
jgi:hypothetical protein